MEFSAIRGGCSVPEPIWRFYVTEGSGMGDVIEQLLSREDVTTSAPGSRADINAFAPQFNAPLPESLVKLWQATDGVTIEGLNARIPGPAEVLQLLAEDAWDKQLVERSLLPVLDDHESNYLAVCLCNPLAFRVLHLPHDDGARVVYRNFESCVGSLIEAADAGKTADLFLFETDGDYPPDAPRPQEDQQAAKTLLTGENKRGEWNHAIQLLDARNLDEWARLLETDHFVRRDIRARMQKMRSDAIRDLLRTDEQAFEEFAKKFQDLVRIAGLKLVERDRECVRVGKVWYELEFFFHRRNIPNAMPRMLAWIEDGLAARNPYDRPRNFMVD
jgi:hypothetical protein